MSYYPSYTNFCIHIPKLLLRISSIQKCFLHISMYMVPIFRAATYGANLMFSVSRFPPSVSCVLTIAVALNRGTVCHTKGRFHGLRTNNKHAIACLRCLVYTHSVDNLNRVQLRLESNAS
jgi:hypothetical protein